MRGLETHELTVRRAADRLTNARLLRLGMSEPRTLRKILSPHLIRRDTCEPKNRIIDVDDSP